MFFWNNGIGQQDVCLRLRNIICKVTTDEVAKTMPEKLCSDEICVPLFQKKWNNGIGKRKKYFCKLISV